jgi:Holliday junction resolvase RusA-like endonuclease
MIALTSELDITPSKSLLSVDIGFYIGMPKSWSKKKKELKNGQYCDNNADVDNYLKAILDSLNEVIYVDDRQIVEIYAKKLYSDKPCIKFNMKIIGDSTNDKGGIM